MPVVGRPSVNTVAMTGFSRHHNVRRHLEADASLWLRSKCRYIMCEKSIFIEYQTLLYAVTLTFDLEYWQCIGSDVVKLCTKIECKRTIRGGVIAFTIFDLMTLNVV